LYVLTPVDHIEHEFAVEGSMLRPVDFLANADVAVGASVSIRFIEDPLPLEKYEVGEHILHLALNDVPFDVLLIIVDTTPPTATSVDVFTVIGEEVTPEQFVTDVFDPSGIKSITFAEQPDVSMPQNQTVKIAIEDMHGNIRVFEAELTIELNQLPPVIEGAETIESEVGTPVIYFYGVTAHDDFGRELEVHIDDSSVNQDVEGTYTAVYWAQDMTGLRSEAEITVHVIRVDPESVYERIDEILSRVLRDGMSQTEQVRAIHNWIMWNLSKATTGIDSQSVLAGADRALHTRRGDSTVYAALAEVMLSRVGIPNMQINRTSEAETAHRWNLVNPDEKGWHHFDAFPTGLVLGPGASMFTDAEAKDFARRIESHNRTKDYFTYDPELYPEIVQE